MAVAMLFTMQNAYGQKQNSKNIPLFSNYKYVGNDKIYEENPLKSNEFYSPILQGTYPDPSITRKGNDYFLVNSSFPL